MKIKMIEAKMETNKEKYLWDQEIMHQAHAQKV